MEDRAKKNTNKAGRNSFSAYDHDEVVLFDDEEYEEYLEEEEYYNEELVED
jgi:hypothetical protein